ncbi:response regulator receiver protein, partial [Archaeoglobales archaeon]
MSLRRNKLIIIGVILLLSVLSTYLVLCTTISSRFDELEQKYVIENSKRIESVLDHELSELDSMCYDWAAWDDTYQFIQDRNQEYIDSNLVDSTFTALKINLMIFVNASGEIVYAKAYDL